MTPLLMDVDGKQQSHSSIRSFGSRTPTILAISYASISGLISGMCLIFAKSAVELLVLTAGGSNQFGRWESWLLVFALGVFALLQVSLIGIVPCLDTNCAVALVLAQVPHPRRSYSRLPL